MNGIDIKLVKEQLRLLGHTVDDAVILAFVQGLGAGSAAVHHAAGAPSSALLRFIITPLVLLIPLSRGCCRHCRQPWCCRQHVDVSRQQLAALHSV